MQPGSGLISKIFGWVTHPALSDEAPEDWAAFLVLALIVAFLWSTVIKEID